MDVISRRKLKTQFKNTGEGMFSLKRVIELINRAQAVEVYSKEELYKQYQMGYATGYSWHDRPKGEWIKADIVTFGSGYDWVYKCSVCDGRSEGATKFCPYCGADMRESNDRR